MRFVLWSLLLVALCWTPARGWLLFEDTYSGSPNQAIDAYDADYTAADTGAVEVDTADIVLNAAGDAVHVVLVDDRDELSESVTTVNDPDFAQYSVGINDGKFIYGAAVFTFASAADFNDDGKAYASTTAIGQGASNQDNEIEFGLKGKDGGVVPYVNVRGGEQTGAALSPGTYTIVFRYQWYTDPSWAAGKDDLDWAVDPTEESDLGGDLHAGGNPQDPGGAVYHAMGLGAAGDTGVWDPVQADAVIDDVRFGTEFDDVVIPEPASAAVVAAGLAGLAAVRRRRESTVSRRAVR